MPRPRAPALGELQSVSQQLFGTVQAPALPTRPTPPSPSRMTISTLKAGDVINGDVSVTAALAAERWGRPFMLALCRRLGLIPKRRSGRDVLSMPIKLKTVRAALPPTGDACVCSCGPARLPRPWWRTSPRW